MALLLFGQQSNGRLTEMGTQEASQTLVVFRLSLAPLKRVNHSNRRSLAGASLAAETFAT